MAAGRAAAKSGRDKFGKHEAEGRRFRSLITEAAAMDIPVLVGPLALNRPVFESFAAGLAIQLPPDLAALLAWVEDVTATAGEAA